MSSLTQEKLDSMCRGLSAMVDMVEGGVEVSLQLPMFTDGDDVPTSKLRMCAYRCPGCEDVHVELEIQKRPEVWDWNKERSDTLLFGPESE